MIFQRGMPNFLLLPGHDMVDLLVEQQILLNSLLNFIEQFTQKFS